MVFTVDVGNTNIVISAYKDNVLTFSSRIATNISKMADQYAIEIKNIIELYNYKCNDFDGAIISSVVPALIPTLKVAVKRALDVDPYIVGPGIKTGLNIKIDDPSILGADLVCGAVGALEKYKSPMIIVDLGTSTTISAINRNNEFLGGSIYPGVVISLETLSDKAANLPHINLVFDENSKVIGPGSISAMKSGMVLGTASMIDGMVERYREEIGDDAVCIVTGGLAGGIVKHCRTKNLIHDRNIVADGLYALYLKNAK